MTHRDEVRDITHCTVLAETDAAVKIATSDGETMWLPLSQVEAIHRTHQQGEDWVTVTRWIAEKKGLL